jgi:hypothetical protein
MFEFRASAIPVGVPKIAARSKDALDHGSLGGLDHELVAQRVGPVAERDAACGSNGAPSVGRSRVPKAVADHLALELREGRPPQVAALRWKRLFAFRENRALHPCSDVRR